MTLSHRVRILMYNSSHDTIAAISTPPGQGGIAILRTSGPDALAILYGLFRPNHESDGRTGCSIPAPGFIFRPRYMHFGHALDIQGRVLDEVLAVYMPGPASATGENIGEIHCHGGMGITMALLEAAQALGARLAVPGEFTRRAFLNGRMDLTQAEAVAELIHSTNSEGARLAAAKLDGVLAREIGSTRNLLDALRIQITLSVDFPEEEAELLSRENFARTVEETLQALRRLLAAYERGRLWTDGAVAVLSGRVNVGKSSLMNALLGRKRAIVSDEAGTTRDYIEERINLSGMPLRLIDTAGLRQGGSFVENEGISRSRELVTEADVVLFVLDARQAFCLHQDTTDDPQATGRCKQNTVRLLPDEEQFFAQNFFLAEKNRIFLVINKIDTIESPDSISNDSQWYTIELSGEPIISLRCPGLCVSARDGQGLPELADNIRRVIEGSGSYGKGRNDHNAGEAFTAAAPNLRQAMLLRKAADELQALRTALVQGMPPDLLSVHLEFVVQFLDEVTGSSNTEQLLDQIFSSFCIGK